MCPPCTLGGEFDCPQGFVCDTTTGFCHDPSCAEATCPPNTVCRGGACVGGCEGIVCPHGQTCRLGYCVSPCDGITCPENEGCVEGLCLPDCRQCGGILCEAPLRCDSATGRCADPTCPSGCPDGTYCKAGSCVDACEGAVCPANQICAFGRCVYPDQIGDRGILPVGDGGTTDGGNNLGGHLTPGPDTGNEGCGCRSTGALPLGIGTLALLLALLGIAERFRRD